MRIIGIHGKAKSGKDEFCNILCKTYGFKQLAFGNKIKEFLIQYFGFSKDLLYECKNKQSRLALQALGSSVRDLISPIYVSMSKGNKLGVSGYPIWTEDIAVNYFDMAPAKLSKKRKGKHKDALLNGILNLWNEKINEFRHIAGNTDIDIWINYLYQQMNDQNVYIISDVRYQNEKDMIESYGGKVVKLIRIDRPNIETGAEHQSEIDLDLVTNWDFTVVNEQKGDWKRALVRSGANMIRKFKSEGFFTKEDIEKFKINLEQH